MRASWFCYTSLLVATTFFVTGCTHSGWNGYNQPAYPIGPYPGTAYGQAGYPGSYPSTFPNTLQPAPSTAAPQVGAIPGYASAQPSGTIPQYTQPLQQAPIGYPYAGGYPGAYPQMPLQQGVPLNQFNPGAPLLGR